MSEIPPLSSVYIYLTDFCNLYCTHCWIDTRTSSDNKIKGVDFVNLKTILVQAKDMGLKSVKLTGGEPFLYFRISDLLRWLKKQGFNISIETNGTLVGKREAMLVAKAVSRVSVSLYGSRAEVHDKMSRVKGSFNNAVSGIQNLIKSGVYVEAVFSIWKENMEDLEDTVIFGRKLGIKRFKINLISNMGRGKILKKKGLIIPVEEILQLRAVIEELYEKLKYPVFLDLPPAFLPLETIKKSPPVCNIKEILGILPDGTISICGAGCSTDKLNIGDINRNSIMDMWNNSKLLADIRCLPERLQGICSRCILKYMCLGKCRAQTFWDDGSMFAPFRFCEQAYEKGLFPEEYLLKSRFRKN